MTWHYPTMTFRNFIKKYASKTEDGLFFCELCKKWVNKQRWLHFRDIHRYAKGKTW